MRLYGAQYRRLIAILIALPVCSNVDRNPGDECREDSDCGENAVCSLAQGNICVLEELPPVAALGFDIKDGDLRVELSGCDPEVKLELGGSELRVQKRSSLVEDFSIVASTRRSVLNCGGNECSGECDEEALTCVEPAPVDLSLTESSRLGLPELVNKKAYVPEPPEGDLPKPAAFTWPTYESEDPKAHAALVLEVTPTAEGNFSAYRRVLAEDATSEIESVGELRCQRGLFGVEGAVRTVSNIPIVGATVEFRYADRTFPSTVLGAASSCDDDEDCLPGWACDTDAGSCGLSLTDVIAGSTVSTELGGFDPAWVYTYCEGMLAPIDPYYREFTVAVTPPAESGLPTALYTVDQPFVDNPTRYEELEDHLCLPDWQPPQKVDFSVIGAPVTLTETELGEYSCCSTECLPSTELGVEPTPPPTIESCSSFSRVRFETRWTTNDPPPEGCLPTASYPDGSNGRFRADVTTCEDTGCVAALTSGHADDVDRSYTITITQPANSVFRSQRIVRPINQDVDELEPFELLPRVLVRGQVTCASSADTCVGTNAVVWAERIRVNSDDTDLPGPFFFEARADAEGNFVLPVDPGVYVITAFPAVGQPGGPARFYAVDLREDSDRIQLVDGVPNATLDEPLVLDDGVLVRVALDGFPLSTGVTPLDIGSWKAQAEFPTEIDLNDPQTCYSTEVGKRRGCAIRRLRPTDATVSLLISERVQFTARSRGSDECE